MDGKNGIVSLISVVLGVVDSAFSSAKEVGDAIGSLNELAARMSRLVLTRLMEEREEVEVEVTVPEDMELKRVSFDSKHLRVLTFPLVKPLVAKLLVSRENPTVSLSLDAKDEYVTLESVNFTELDPNSLLFLYYNSSHLLRILDLIEAEIESRKRRMLSLIEEIISSLSHYALA